MYSCTICFPPQVMERHNRLCKYKKIQLTQSKLYMYFTKVRLFSQSKTFTRNFVLTASRKTKNWMQYFLKIQHYFVTHSDISNGNNKTTVCQWAGQNCKEILLDLSTLHVCYPFSKHIKQASLAELAGKLRGK